MMDFRRLRQSRAIAAAAKLRKGDGRNTMAV